MTEIYHLNKVIEIQRDFIDGKIDREELDKLLKEENKRYISVLKAKNIELKINIDSERISQAITNAIQKQFRT